MRGPDVLKWTLLAAGAACLAGCVTTDPREGASIGYHLPSTDASATLDLTLASCDSFEATPTLSVSASAGAQPKLYTVWGRDLASSRLSRTVKITVSDSDVINGVNTVSNDRSAQIIGSAIKIGSVALPALLTYKESLTGPKCRPEVRLAWIRSFWLTQQIQALKTELATKPDPKTDGKKIERVNAMAQELAALRTGDGLLHVQTTATIPLTAQASGWTTSPKTALQLDAAPFAKWFQETPEQKTVDEFYGLQFDLASVSAPPVPPPFGKHWASQRGCGQSITVPAVETVRATVSTTGSKLIEGPDKARAALHEDQTFALAQWKPEGAQLCIDAGFGENRTINVAYDGFGRTTSLEWTSDATAENVTSAIAGYAPDINTIGSMNKGATLAHQNAEIDRLKTQQSLNQWRACQEILDAGGYTCPGGGGQ